MVPQINSTANWTNFPLPVTVGELVSYFDNYTEFIPCEIPCAYCSLYKWEMGDGLKIEAYALEVGEEELPSKQHEIELYNLTAKNHGVVENILYGLSLNKTTLSECKQRFNLKNTEIPFIDGDNKYKFSENEIFTYLYFNSSEKIEKIEKIEQCTFDIELTN